MRNFKKRKGGRENDEDIVAKYFTIDICHSHIGENDYCLTIFLKHG
jgi:hypothetical protein